MPLRIEHDEFTAAHYAPPMSEAALLTALGHLDDASALLGHLPSVYAGWLVGVLLRRDHAAIDLARRIAAEVAA